MSYGAGSLSGLVAAVPDPRAVVVALHGGGVRSAYFHGRAHADVSMFDTGQLLGYTVLALDRPGYGASVGVS